MPSKEKNPAMDKDICYELISKHSIQAMSCHKGDSRSSAYKEEILALSQACAALVIIHAESPQSIIKFMEVQMVKEHHHELEKLNQKIQHLFKIRKGVSSHTAHGEEDIARLTIQITELEQEKQREINPIIRNIVHDSLVQACKNNGIDIPDGFLSFDYDSGK